MIKRAIWRWLLAWRFRLFQRHRYRTLVLEEIAGRPFVVLPDVFNPALFRSSEFLVEQLGHLPSGLRVLDMGTGSGIGAVFAACRAQRVIAVDINPEAVRCVQVNALLNRVDDCICVRQGDLFAPVQDEQFDLILFNPPYFRGEPNDAHDYAWRSNHVVERFAAGLPQHLTPTGYALVVLSTDGDTSAFLEAFRHNGLCVEVVANRDLVNEILTVYKLSVET